MAKTKPPKEAPKQKCADAKKQSRDKYKTDAHYAEFLPPDLICP